MRPRGPSGRVVGDPTSRLREAQRLFASGDAAGASKVCAGLLRAMPSEPAVAHLGARCLIATGLYDRAVEVLRPALSANPRSAELLHVLASAHGRAGRLDEAIGALDRALKARPGFGPMLAFKADLLYQAGRFDEAYAAIEPALDGDKDDPAVARALATIARRVGQERRAIKTLRRVLDAGAMERGYEVDALFRLGELHDALGEHDEAFACWRRANGVRGPRPDADRYVASIEAMLDAWTAEAYRALPRSAEASELPVFIVGMPRSGTTLIEQIIDSHGACHGAGEREDIGVLVRELQAAAGGPTWHLTRPDALNKRSLDRTARAHVRRLAALAPTAARITDKNPLNYLNVGLISLLHPRARVVHCIRNPADTCVSIYSHHIVGQHSFPNDLGELGAWHNRYRRVMRHWASLVDVPILDVVYEELIADQEAQTRRLIEFLGLEWDESCLRFFDNRRANLTPSADQVRRPIYTSSVERWRRYVGSLRPLIETLEEDERYSFEQA